MDAGARYIRKRQVLALTPFGATVLHNKMVAGEFPRPVAYLSPTLPVWDALAVDAAIERIVEDAKRRGQVDLPKAARAARGTRKQVNRRLVETLLAEGSRAELVEATP